MLAVKGIYDGKNVRTLEKTPKNKKYKVVITFIEEINEAEDIRNFSSNTSAFKFWENPKEDIYQEFISKKHK